MVARRRSWSLDDLTLPGARAGADRAARSDEGRTALDYAKADGHADVVARLER